MKSAESRQMVKGFRGKVGEGREEETDGEVSTYYVPGSLVGHFTASIQYPSWRRKRGWKQMALGGFRQISTSTNSVERDQAC